MKTRWFHFQVGLVGLTAFIGLLREARAQHPLDSWVQRTVPSPNGPLQGVAFGNGVFVAVGDNSLVARSSDGAAWTTSSAGAYGSLRRVRFLNGQFLAVGTSDKLIASTDGAIWTAVTLPQANFWDVAWGDGVYVLAGAGTYASPDGVNWTATHPILQGGVPLANYETTLDTVVFGNGRFLAMPAGKPPGDLTILARSLVSINGVDWAPVGTGQRGEAGGIGELVNQGDLWVSTSESDGNHNPGYGLMVSSNNGTNWCCQFPTSVIGHVGGALSFGDGYFVWIESAGFFGRQIFTSTNAFNWDLRYTETNQVSTRSCAFGNGTFVAVGQDSANNSYILQSGNISGVPIIVQEPADRSAVVGNPATFTVQAVGAPTLGYQWYRDGSIISGATNASYGIAQVTTGDVGGYRVVIANSFGSATSRVAQLTVAFLDIDLYAGIKVLGVPGRTYRIEATPASGTPNWQTLTNLVLPSNPYIWIDYESPSNSARLYRASELP